MYNQISASKLNANESLDGPGATDSNVVTSAGTTLIVVLLSKKAGNFTRGTVTERTTAPII
jgi:hypothetical protein